LSGQHSLLGEAFILRSQIEEGAEDDPDNAIRHLEFALSVITKEKEPDEWAGNIGNVALAYKVRRTGDRNANLRCAIDYFRQTEAVFSRGSFPELWANTQSNIAGLFLDLRDGNQNEHESKAVELLRSALSVYTSTTQPVKFVETQRHLGDIYLKKRDWSEAHAAYGAAFEAASYLYGKAFTPTGRQSELALISGLSSQDAHVLVQLGQRNRALERLEQGRAKLLKDALTSEDPAISNMDESVRLALKTHQERIDRLESEMQSAPVEQNSRRIREVAEELRVARTAFRTLTSIIKSKG
jgi:tetratricopeptide (TPR) repeat protein